jgi:hypothetical protein
VKLAVYCLGFIVLFVLVGNLIGIALKVFKFHEQTGSQLRAAAVLVIAVLSTIWGTWRLAGLPGETWTHAARYVGEFARGCKWWLVGATAASFIGFISMGATGELLFTALDSTRPWSALEPAQPSQPTSRACNSFRLAFVRK